MKDFDFSIIIPVYNTQEYLNLCIDSVLSQTVENYQIILVDDGSNDNCGKICDDYEKKDNRISVIHKENGGLSSARNVGIKQASGNYLFFLDSDDILLDADSLEKTFEILNSSNPDIACVLSEKIDENSKKQNIKDLPFMYGDEIFEGTKKFDELVFDDRVITCAWNKVCRRDFIVENNLFFCEGIYHEDDEWIPRILVTAKKIIFINVYAYGYRQRANSITTSTDEKVVIKRAFDRMMIAESTLNFLSDKWQNNNEFRKNATNYYMTYFISSIFTYNNIKDESSKKDFYTNMKKYWGIFKYAKHSKSANQRKLYLINLFLRQKISFKILNKRHLRDRG